jgi:hypothetical protein
MLKKSMHMMKFRKAFSVGFLMIFLAGFCVEIVFTLHDQYNTELADSGGEESDEEETENSKKGWNDDFIPSEFTFRAILINFSLAYHDHNYTELNQLQSVYSPPPDLI